MFHGNSIGIRAVPEEKQLEFGQWVEVEFDCLPLRSVTRVDVPIDASPKLADKMLRLKAALETHGTLGSYFLHNATCRFHLTNDPMNGMLQYSFEGVILTDENDMNPRCCDLQVELVKETCSWLNQSIVDRLSETVQRTVMVEFERYIAAGDLNATIERLEKLQRESDETGGFVGMYL